MRTRKGILLILDGWGSGKPGPGNAIASAPRLVVWLDELQNHLGEGA